jgi:hypothetical protein
LGVHKNGLFENFRGHNEKYLYSARDHQWYFILPNGEFYRWQGSLEGSQLLAELSSDVWQSPEMLHDAQPNFQYRHSLGKELALGVHKNGLFENFRGHNEKYLYSARDHQWYFILPNGEFYKWQGSIEDSRLLASFDASYWSNPEMLYGRMAINPSVSVDANTGQLTIDANAQSVGEFTVAVHADDGYETTTRYIRVETTNAAPTVAPTGTVAASNTTDTVTIQLDLDDTDGDTVTAKVSKIDKLAEIDRALQLGVHKNGLFENYRGQNEKYLYSAPSHQWYFVLPNGEFYRWKGSIAGSELLAELSTDVWTNPELLYHASTAQQITAAADVVFNQGNGQLTIDPDAGYDGEVDFAVEVSDGISTTRKIFSVALDELSDGADAVSLVDDDLLDDLLG